MNEKLLKKGYKWYRDFSHLIDRTSHFLLILAFVITLPLMEEIGYAWLGAFITLSVGINMTFKSLETIQPEIKLEEDFKRAIDDMKTEIKSLEGRIEKNESKKNI